MNSFRYEAVAIFAQQAGLIYFGLIFLAGVIYALRLRHRADFERLAKLPLEDDGDHV